MGSTPIKRSAEDSSLSLSHERDSIRKISTLGVNAKNITEKKLIPRPREGGNRRGKKGVLGPAKKEWRIPQGTRYSYRKKKRLSQENLFRGGRLRGGEVLLPQKGESREPRGLPKKKLRGNSRKKRRVLARKKAPLTLGRLTGRSGLSPQADRVKAWHHRRKKKKRRVRKAENICRLMIKA